MLNLLRNRYKYLCQAKFDKAEQIEAKLTEIKNENYEKLVRPILFWCTFKDGAAQRAALNLESIDCRVDEEAEDS